MSRIKIENDQNFKQNCAQRHFGTDMHNLPYN